MPGFTFLLAGGIALFPAVGCEGPDTDQDGLSDLCELRLAQRFAPALVASSAACNWDASRAQLSGGYLFGVAPTEGGVRIAYLPAYTMDCGWSGPKCWIRWRGGCDPQVGDSEFIAIDVERREGQWELTRVFLSAHCFGDSEGDCRWHEVGEMQRFGSRLLVWVAEGKNANYTSRAACDRAHFRYDTCDRNESTFRYPIESNAQNIGSEAHPFPAHPNRGPCVAPTGLPGLDAPGAECIWSRDRFRGWSGQSVPGATGYWRYLTEVVGWMELTAGTHEAGPAHRVFGQLLGAEGLLGLDPQRLSRRQPARQECDE